MTNTTTATAAATATITQDVVLDCLMDWLPKGLKPSARALLGPQVTPAMVDAMAAVAMARWVDMAHVHPYPHTMVFNALKGGPVEWVDGKYNMVFLPHQPGEGFHELWAECDGQGGGGSML